MKDYEIRRKDRAVDENAALEILKSGSFGVLSTIGADGYPYGVPVNYAYNDGKIYFHCAKNVGHKQDNLRFSGKVSFTVVTKSDVISENSQQVMKVPLLLVMRQNGYRKRKSTAASGAKILSRICGRRRKPYKRRI